MWNLEIDGNHEDNGSSSWSDNDISSGAEYHAPMFTHGLFNYSSGSHTIGLDATAESWTSSTDSVQYKIGASTTLIAYTGGMTVVGKSNPITSSNTAATNICVGSAIGWSGCPADGTPQLITSATVNIPSGHNGVVLFTAATRIQGNGTTAVACSPPVCSPSQTNFVEGGGFAELYLTIDGVGVGSTGVQQLDTPDTISTRTLSINHARRTTLPGQKGRGARGAMVGAGTSCRPLRNHLFGRKIGKPGSRQPANTLPIRSQHEGDGTISMTLEQLCRASWNADKKGFKKMAEEIRIYQGFVRRFQDEENGEASLEALRRLDAQR